jgi:hypothetical protein
MRALPVFPYKMARIVYRAVVIFHGRMPGQGFRDGSRRPGVY